MKRKRERKDKKRGIGKKRFSIESASYQVTSDEIDSKDRDIRSGVPEERQERVLSRGNLVCREMFSLSKTRPTASFKMEDLK